MADLATQRQRRGIPCGHITKLKTKVDEWVYKGGLSAIDLLSVEQAKARLHTLDADIKRYHMDVIDALEDVTKEIESEEDVMEEHEIKITHIIIGHKSIRSSAPNSSESTGMIKTESKGIEVLRRCLANIS